MKIYPSDIDNAKMRVICLKKAIEKFEKNNDYVMADKYSEELENLEYALNFYEDNSHKASESILQRIRDASDAYQRACANGLKFKNNNEDE